MREEARVQLTVVGHVAQVLLNAPPMNCIDHALLQDLSDVIAQIEEEPRIRVVVLGSRSEKVFSAGADIKQFEQWDADLGVRESSFGSAIYRRLAALPVPVICAVNGGAYGGGCELALACDMRLMDRNAKIGLPECGLGVVPSYGGTQRLTELIGVGRAGYMLYSGEIIRAQQAYEWGLCERLTEPGQVWAEACALAERIAAKAPMSVRGIKRCMQKARAGLYLEGFSMENTLFGELCDTEDKREGVHAFLEKRVPSFKNR